MGRYIHESISKSVTREEWEGVYEEAMLLAEALQLGEEKDYQVPEDLVGSGTVEAEGWDAMMEALPLYLDFGWDEEIFWHTYSLWDVDAQGKPYFTRLLAVACLLEDRLGEKAFVYGNITKDQCQEAVELANPYLRRPIRVPDRCERERLYRRIQKLPFEEAEKVAILEEIYLGVKDPQFLEFERAHFREEALHGCWRERFSQRHVGTRGFLPEIKKYLAMGLSLEELCEAVNLKDTEGQAQYKVFIKAIMDSKLHWKEKNTIDYPEKPLPLEEGKEYGLWLALALLAFGAAHNPRVARYIPMEEIRQSLKKKLGSKVDVDALIDQYLQIEGNASQIDIHDPELSTEDVMERIKADAAGVYTQIMDQWMQQAQGSIAEAGNKSQSME